jgi:tetratricopeptide (TPR) repeat protein
MKGPIQAALAIALCLPSAAWSAEWASSAAPRAPQLAAPDTAPQAPLTPHDRDELQARIYMAKKQYPEAVQVYSKLSQQSPKNPSYPNFIGIALLQEGKISDARKFFLRATKVNKRFAEAYNNLGASYYAEKQYGKAISQYRKALGLEPNTASLYTNLGYAYFAQKQLPQAMEAFHKALSIDPNVFDVTGRSGSILSYRSVADRGLFNFVLAKGYAQDGDVANCAVYLRRAVEEGYKDVLKARTDPAFAKVLDDPNVKAVLDEAALQQNPAPAPAPENPPKS